MTTDLSLRRFELDELVQVRIRGTVYHGRIFSHGDGRNLKRSKMGGDYCYDGWVYEVSPEGGSWFDKKEIEV